MTVYGSLFGFQFHGAVHTFGPKVYEQDLLQGHLGPQAKYRKHLYLPKTKTIITVPDPETL